VEKISKQAAKKKIDEFFQRNNFSAEDVKKIKKLAMKYNIKLGVYRKKFCKKCFSKLTGKTRVSAGRKIVICDSCGFENSFKLFFDKKA
jgi:RNase P subunit RPR2